MGTLKELQKQTLVYFSNCFKRKKMKKSTILSLVTASFLIIGCSGDSKEATVQTKVVEPKTKMELIVEDMNQLADARRLGIYKSHAPKDKEDAKETSHSKAYDYKLKAKQVSDTVWCFFGLLEGPSTENAGAMSNTCYIKTEDSFVLFDSGPSYEYAKQAYAQMKKIADLPVKAVILSHEHDDHWLGNNFYKEKFGAKLIGPNMINTEYKAGDQTRMFQKLPDNAIKGTKIIKVDESPKKSTTLTIGGEVFEIVHIDTKAHTPDDYFMYMPKRKVLFAGDLVMNGRITSNRHGSLLGQLKAIEMIKSKDWDILVPGHGFIYDKTALDEAEQYFTQMKEKIVKALDEDIELTDIDPTEMMKEFKDKAMFKALNGQNVQEGFTEIEFAE